MDKMRAAVIGSGFGGLSLAIRLQAAGCRTTIFEKRDKPGGRAYVYRDQGFSFDAGPTVITAPDCLRELFALATLDAREEKNRQKDLGCLLPHLSKLHARFLALS
jgi:phytoene dehydrogenase-like protein